MTMVETEEENTRTRVWDVTADQFSAKSWTMTLLTTAETDDVWEGPAETNISDW